MGIAAGAMGGGGLMALGGELMGLGLGMDQIQTARQGSVRLRSRGRRRPDDRRNHRRDSRPGAVHLRGRAVGADAGVFPAWGEADWRKAAEAALKGASLDTLASSTADGIRIEPLYRAGRRRPPLRADGALARDRAPRPSRSRARPTPRRSTTSPTAPTACRSCSPGAVGAYGFGLRRPDPATLHRAFEGVRFDAGPCFELDLGRDGAGEATELRRAGRAVGRISRRLRASPSASIRIAASARSGRSRADWGADVEPFVGAALALRARGFAGPFLVADARASTRRAARPRRSSPSRSAPRSASCARSTRPASRSTRRAADRVPPRRRRRRIRHARRSFARCGCCGPRIEQACGLEAAPAHVQAESAWRMMTARDPYVNVMRGAIAAFAAGLGGADSVSVLPHTLGARPSRRLARRLARNGQLILLRESHLGFVADPAAGAGAFEALTASALRAGVGVVPGDRSRGRPRRGAASGAFQREVAESAAALEARRRAAEVADHRRQRACRSRREPLRDRAGAPRARICRRAAAARSRRCASPSRSSACATLRRHLEARGARPKVVLVAIGPSLRIAGASASSATCSKRAGSSRSMTAKPATPDEAIAARFTASGASLACLCGDDAAYAAHGERSRAR